MTGRLIKILWKDPVWIIVLAFFIVFSIMMQKEYPEITWLSLYENGILRELFIYMLQVPMILYYTEKRDYYMQNSTFIIRFHSSGKLQNASTYVMVLFMTFFYVLLFGITAGIHTFCTGKGVYQSIIPCTLMYIAEFILFSMLVIEIYELVKYISGHQAIGAGVLYAFLLLPFVLKQMLCWAAIHSWSYYLSFGGTEHFFSVGDMIQQLGYMVAGTVLLEMIRRRVVYGHEVER